MKRKATKAVSYSRSFKDVVLYAIVSDGGEADFMPRPKKVYRFNDQKEIVQWKTRTP